ncbi:Thioredoxin-like protein [Corchorus olitorius]|uniref:Thioredoxin-like protein n=1 Tax=Corchorus olitorius TaxID=93759 RepID=A0A1R3G465_9ROSI|nr:Thioredoxin-like protein [Corchorus olitorius]
MYSSMEAVKEAYENLEFKWNSGLEVPTTNEFIKIRYAYELLTNPIWKRNYDVFGIDEQPHIVEKVSQQHEGGKYSDVELPLLHADAYDTGDNVFNVITSNDFQSMFEDSKPWLLQVYSSGSNRSAQFLNSWRRIADLLNGVANIGMVELGEIQIAAYLAERKPTGQFFFRNGLPSVVAFPSGCQTSDCLIRFEGELSVDAVTDWFASAVLNLPRIFYYSKESLGSVQLPKCVKLQRTIGTMPLLPVSYGVKRNSRFGGIRSISDSWFIDVLEQNKQQELPQLRSLTSEELGCNARGYSRAGRDTLTWYCAILAGRLGPELDSMRETMRRVQETLSKSSELNAAGEGEHSITSTIALKNKRLTFTWLDGEAQKNYCFFYLHSENSYETCGPRSVPTDVPRLFIVRYERNASEDTAKVEKKAKTIWDLNQHEVDPAAQLSVTYNGSAEITEIIQWISTIIKDGDSRKLPFYRVKTPELVPEDAEPFWSRGPQGILSKSTGAKQKIQSIMIRTYDYLGDPRIGPALLLGSLMSFGSIWLMRSKQNRPVQSSQPNQADNNDKPRQRERPRRRNASNKDIPPSVTDSEPRDSYQMPLSDSD